MSGGLGAAHVPATSGVIVRSVRLADVGPDREAFLERAELARAAGIKDAQTRRDFLAGRIALRNLAAGLLGVRPGQLTAAYSCPDCGTGPEVDHGQPGYRLDGAPAGISLSLSRCRGWALLAAVVHREPGLRLGVDVEDPARTDFAGFDDVALAPAERRGLQGLPPRALLRERGRLWARKEAWLKMAGDGLRTAPDTLDVLHRAKLRDLAPAETGLPPDLVAAVAVSDASELSSQ